METWISWRLVREHQPRKVGPQLLQRRHDFLVDLAEDTLLRVAIPMTTIQELHIPYLCMPWTARFCPTGCPGYPAPWGGYIEIPGAFSSRNALGCRWCSTRSTSKKSSPRASSKPRRSPASLDGDDWMGRAFHRKIRQRLASAQLSLMVMFFWPKTDILQRIPACRKRWQPAGVSNTLKILCNIWKAMETLLSHKPSWALTWGMSYETWGINKKQAKQHKWWNHDPHIFRNIRMSLFSLEIKGIQKNCWV